MSKLISLLPEDVRVVALQRQREETSDKWDKNTDILEEAFWWDDTPEKHEIWEDVSADNYTPFRQFHANLKQYEENKPVTLQWIRENFGIIIDEPISNEWISVSERLPDNYKKVLVFYENEITTGTFFEKHSYDENGWEIPTTHWQPLPEPPKTN